MLIRHKANKVDAIDALVQEGYKLPEACQKEKIQIKTYRQYKKELIEHLALYDEIKDLKTQIANLKATLDAQRNRARIADDYDIMRKKVEKYERFILKTLIKDE